MCVAAEAIAMTRIMIFNSAASNSDFVIANALAIFFDESLQNTKTSLMPGRSWPVKLDL